MKHSLISCSCMIGSSKSSALVCFWSDFAGNYPGLNSKISHFTFMPAGNLTAWSQREFSFPRHRHLRLTLCHQTSFTLWDQTRHLIASHQFMAELGCELIICSIVRLRGLPGGLFFFFPLKEANTKGACDQQMRGGCRLVLWQLLPAFKHASAPLCATIGSFVDDSSFFLFFF